jgi:hypothetical protein
MRLLFILALLAGAVILPLLFIPLLLLWALAWSVAFWVGFVAGIQGWDPDRESLVEWLARR